MEPTSSGPVVIEVNAVRAPDGSKMVCLQIPDGYVLMRPDGARTVAEMLTSAAAEAER